jgi:hypothetical protein
MPFLQNRTMVRLLTIYLSLIRGINNIKLQSHNVMFRHVHGNQLANEFFRLKY